MYNCNVFQVLIIFPSKFSRNSLHAVGWIFVLLFVVHKQVQQNVKRVTKK